MGTQVKGRETQDVTNQNLREKLNCLLGLHPVETVHRVRPTTHRKPTVRTPTGSLTRQLTF